MDAAVGQFANWLQIAHAPSDVITIGAAVWGIIQDYRENLPVAAKQARERLEHADALLRRLEPAVSSEVALHADLTTWKSKLQETHAAVNSHNGDPTWWGASAAVDALESVISDVNGLLDDVARTLHVDAFAHRRQKMQAKSLEQNRQEKSLELHDALLWHSRRTTEGFSVDVYSAAPRSSKFRLLELYDAAGLDADVSNGRGQDGSSSTSGEGDRAAARKGGGYEVKEGAKIRFAIKCQFPDNWYFYIITVDRSSSEDKLQLYFPEFVDDSNSLSFDRIFPSEELDRYYFPLTLSCTGHNSMAYESITLFMVVTPQRLEKASSKERIKLEEVEHHMLHNARDKIIVKRFDFDIKKLIVGS